MRTGAAEAAFCLDLFARGVVSAVVRCRGPMARRELLRVRLDSDEREALDRLARARGGLTRSELVRDLIREASPVPPPPPTIEELLEPYRKRG
jgi:hypothetical protein